MEVGFAEKALRMRKEEAMQFPFDKMKGEDLWAFAGDSDKAPPSTLSPLLTFRERDFLLSADGTQVSLSLSLSVISLR